MGRPLRSGDAYVHIGVVELLKMALAGGNPGGHALPSGMQGPIVLPTNPFSWLEADQNSIGGLFNKALKLSRVLRWLEVLPGVSFSFFPSLAA